MQVVRGRYTLPWKSWGPTWGSSGSAIRTGNTLSQWQCIRHRRYPRIIAMIDPNNCSLSCQCVFGEPFNARIIGERRHKSPVGAMAMDGIRAHLGTPLGLDHLQRIVSMRTPGALTLRLVRAEDRHTLETRNSRRSAYTVLTFPNGVSASLVHHK